MKRVLFCALLVIALAGYGSKASAQTPEAGAQAAGNPHRMPLSTDQRLQHLAKELNLTDDQQQKIRPILENESQQMQSLRQGPPAAGQDRWSKIQEIRQTTNSQIKPILNADQQKRYEEMTARHAPPPGGMGQGPAAPPPPQGMGQDAAPPPPPQ